MIKTEQADAHTALCEIITKRIDKDTFFANDAALHRCIDYSGGCIRQLFQIINRGISKTRGERKIDVAVVEAVTDELGNSMRESINFDYVKLLQSETYEPADAKIKEMLYGLLLLKYNGKNSIKINPILEKYMKNAGELRAK